MIKLKTLLIDLGVFDSLKLKRLIIKLLDYCIKVLIRKSGYKVPLHPKVKFINELSNEAGLYMLYVRTGTTTKY